MFLKHKTLFCLSSFIIMATAVKSSAEPLVIDGKTYQDLNGSTGVALNVTDQSEITIKNTKFLNNTATGYAAGAYLYKAKLINLDNVEFIGNYSKSGGSALRIVTVLDDDAVINITNSIFKGNKTDMGSSFNRGGALVADKGTYNLDNVKFIENSAASGGAIYVANSAKLYLKNSLFDGNFTNKSFGGAIVATTDAQLYIDNTVFQNNSALNEYDAGAISVYDGQPATIEYIKNSKFINNKAEGDGGAISSSGGIKFIENTLFENNQSAFEYKGAEGGGAIWMLIHRGFKPVIYNSNFVENKSGKYGGALHINGSSTDPVYIVDTSFIGNTATVGGGAGGAIYSTGNFNIYADKKDVLFTDNKAKWGNDIYFNVGSEKVINLAANDGKKIVFNGGIMGSSSEKAIININSAGNEYILSDGNTYNVGNSGEVQFNNTVSRVTLNLYNGTMSVGQNAKNNEASANPDGWINGNNLNTYGGVINSVNGVIGTMTFNNLSLNNSTQLHIDVDLANAVSDLIAANGTTAGDGELVISKMNVISDSTKEQTSIVFASDELKDKVRLDVNEVMSDIWKYGVNYNAEDGSFDFVRGDSALVPDPNPDDPNPDPDDPNPDPGPHPQPRPENFNPYLYEKSVTLSYIANLQKSINQLVFNDLKDVQADFVTKSDEIGGKNIWIKLSGFDDNYHFENFDDVDTKTALLTMGMTSNPIWFDKAKAKWSIYGGTVQGKSKYENIKINERGGYLGAMVSVEHESWVYAGNLTSGYLRSHADNMYGTDKYDSFWGGMAAKIGYNLKMPSEMVLQPSIHAGWSMIDARDYTNAAGRRMESETLQVFEWAPNLKLSKDFSSGWKGFVQGRYVFAENSGGKTKVENINLPDIEAKNYAEYGFGFEKKQGDYNFEASIYRRDGQREGWNGYLGMQWLF